MPPTEELIQKLKERAKDTPESKSKRIQVLVTPTMFDSLKSLKEDTGLSVNEIINLALEEYMKK